MFFAMTTALNRALMQFTKRAESGDPSTLMSTFVDAGPLFNLLNTADHQIVFGRRGTGKTHAFIYLQRQLDTAGDWAVYTDLRNVGSSGGLYADESVPLAERATRLLLDVLAEIQSAMTTRALQAADEDDPRIDVVRALRALDALADEITQVRVTGQVETEESARTGTRSASGVAAEVSVTPSLSMRADDESSQEQGRTVRRTGVETHYVHFGGVGAALRRLTEAFAANQRLWILLDEWSAIPLELQPILADLLRRSLFPTPSIVVKIAAIEHRSRFIARRPGDYVGIEVGADASANVDLDDFMVFGSNAQTAEQFFRELLYRHVVAIMSADRFKGPSPPISAEQFVAEAFTQSATFTELVRAAEGVPRDALNVVGLAAMAADDDRISITDIRSAARRWYQRDKESAVVVNAEAQRLLNWIIDTVIEGKRTKGFLLDPTGIDDDNVRHLYDARTLHLLRRGISSRDRPGVRFNAYALDFGCYVHLTAAKAPQTLFQAEGEDGPIDVDVPSDDYRSIRTAILDLGRFYNPAAYR